MSLSWAVPGTKVTYHSASTMEKVPAVVVGPSKLDGDFLSIQYEVKGRTITHDCAPLHRLEFAEETKGVAWGLLWAVWEGASWRLLH